MQLTAHKTVTQFMRYVHTEDDRFGLPPRLSRRADAVVLSGQRTSPQPAHNMTAVKPAKLKAPVAKPTGFDDGRYSSNTKLRKLSPLPTSLGYKSPSSARNETHGKSSIGCGRVVRIATRDYQHSTSSPVLRASAATSDLVSSRRHRAWFRIAERLIVQKHSIDQPIVLIMRGFRNAEITGDADRDGMCCLFVMMP